MMTLSAFRVRWVALVLLSSTVLLSCNDDDDTAPATTYGASVAIGNGAARSYVTTDGSGKPTEIGVRLGETALNGLPATPVTGVMYDLPLPAAASQTPFDHISFDWNPIGHEPAGVYTTPHFDAHFYIQPMAAQHTITLDDPKGDIFPAAAMLPTGYITAPTWPRAAPCP